MTETLEPPVLDSAALARRIAELPPMPRALQEALRIMQDDRHSAAGCVTAIEADSTLSARVLRLANSPFYGVSGRIANVADAVSLLGLRSVTGVLTAVSMQALQDTLALAPAELSAYGRHALLTAVAARLLAPAAGQDPDEAFLAGLLHDVGELMLAVFLPAAHRQVLALAGEEQIDRRSAELRLLEQGHDEVGARVVRAWNFPATIAAAIAGHHQPVQPRPGQAASLCVVIHAADAVARTASPECARPGMPSPEPARWVWRAVALDDALLPMIRERTLQGAAALAGC